MSFDDRRTHGFVRVAAATPAVRVGDPDANAGAAVDLIEAADRRDVDLVVFPELHLSSYAIDDLHQQRAIQSAVVDAVATVVAATEAVSSAVVVGAPLVHDGDLYNTAIVAAGGRLLGVVPKGYLPNYREYYEKRWFRPGRGVEDETIRVGDVEVPFGTDLLFTDGELDGLRFGVEICEDLWAPDPPSTRLALGGALIVANPSASNIVVGKARDRELMCASQSMRALCGYVYSAAGPGESTTDLAWDGQGLVTELGEVLARSDRFPTEPELVVADLDTDRILADRQRNMTFGDTRDDWRDELGHLREIGVTRGRSGDGSSSELARTVPRFPFVPDDPHQLEADCYEAFNIQVEGLVTRFRATGGRRVVIGVSGGIDSTHALIVAAKAFDRMGLDRAGILAYTMPGFGTSDRTRTNADRLMEAMGVTAHEIDIRPAARQMLADLGHPFADGEPVYDVTFENVQAGLRTDYLFRAANHQRGFVIGTGDLSELALGWCTYGVGDQMSHYGVNAGVPKTLIQYLIRWTVATGQFDADTDRVLADILDTEISPELVPAGEDEEIQSTEDLIGPYELHDFFLHHVVRWGAAPSKVLFLARAAWGDRDHGDWPDGIEPEARNQYSTEEIRRWLEVFLRRFFGFSQFKRSALPNGPKVSSGGALSPRGDWRAPSDGTAAPFLAELAANGPGDD